MCIIITTFYNNMYVSIYFFTYLTFVISNLVIFNANLTFYFCFIDVTLMFNFLTYCALCNKFYFVKFCCITLIINYI